MSYKVDFKICLGKNTQKSKATGTKMPIITVFLSISLFSWLVGWFMDGLIWERSIYLRQYSNYNPLASVRKCWLYRYLDQFQILVRHYRTKPIDKEQINANYLCNLHGTENLSPFHMTFQIHWCTIFSCRWLKINHGALLIDII